MSSTDTSPVIGFIDIDAFECQLFQREQPQFRNLPCVVATFSGRILSATYEAKACGVSRSTTPNVRNALKVCPELIVFRKPDMWGKQDSSKTRHATWELLDTIKEFCTSNTTGGGKDIIIELASSDELYLDISGEVTRALHKKKQSLQSRFKSISIPDNIVWERLKSSQRGPLDYSLQRENYWKQKNNSKAYLDYIFQEEERLIFGSLFMDALCSFIENKIHLTSSGGVARNKLLAKVGCGINKPGKITICPSNSIIRVAKSIPITSIPGLGGSVGEKLTRVLEVKWMSELRYVQLTKLEAEFDTELSQRILSWAEGKDNQPVEARVMKDKFSCNKPSGAIKGIPNLEKTLQDLVEEMRCRLQEEHMRHGRVFNTIRVDLTFMVNPQQVSINKGAMKDGPETISTSTAYDTTDEKFKMSNLQVRMLEFIKNTPGFDFRNFIITELGLTGKDFVFLDQAVESLQTKLNGLSITFPQKTLRVHIKVNNTTAKPTYQSKPPIGSFRTTADGKYCAENVRFPTLRPHDNLMNFRKTNLGQGYELPETKSTKLIMDHAEYYELKHNCFIKWLRESKYFKNFSKPDFITFHGRIADPMQTPLTKKWGDWEIYAMNIGGIIFLWDQKQPQAQMNEAAYYGTFFRALVTNEGKSPDEAIVQEFDKSYLINEASLGKHQLLVVNHVDAQDENGQQVQMSLFNQYHWPRNSPQTESRKLKLWTQTLVSGAKRILIGLRDQSGVLQEIEDFEIEEFRTSQLSGDTSICLEFENRLLEWIKLHLPVSNEKVVKKFSWVGGHQNVVSDLVSQQEVPKLTVPRLYSSLFREISE